MRRQLQYLLCVLVFGLCGLRLPAAPLGTAFTYQGRLNDGGSPANGAYDLRFVVFDAAQEGSGVSGVLTNAATPLSNGLFTVTLDFGAGVFDGSARWLEIGVRPAGSPADFAILVPRQPLAPAPSALYAPSAGQAGTAGTVTGPVAAGQLIGTIASSNIAAGSISATHLAPGSVTSQALADGAVSLGKLQLANTSCLLTVITNPTPGQDDYFGFAMAMVGGDKVLVGAPQDDTGAKNTGAAYLFTLSGSLLTTFTNPLPVTNDYFGQAVAAVGSDKVLIGCHGADYGADGAGGAYLYDLDGNLLTTFTNPTPAAADSFGYAVAAVGSNRVLIGAYQDDPGAKDAGAAYLFDTNGTLLTTFTNPTPANADYFGSSVAGVGTDQVLIGAPQDSLGGSWSGAAYLFSTDGTLLVTITNPTPAANDLFGFPVVWAGADKILIGALGDALDSAYLFDLSGKLLATFNNPYPPVGAGEDFGCGLTAAGPDKVLIGTPGDSTGSSRAGSAYLFSSGGRLLTAYTNPAPSVNERFGISVAAPDANTLLIGAYGDKTGALRAGAVYVYSSATYFPGLAGDGAMDGSITSSMLATGSVGNAQLAAGSVTAEQMAPGAAVSNLTASGYSPIPSGGVILSANENPSLVSLGFVKIGELTSLPEKWQERSSSLFRKDHTAVWTGTEMIVWGGYDCNFNWVNTGSRYNPALNSWTPTSTTAAPEGRERHTAVWTGSKMIVWGGTTSDCIGCAFNTGGRYDPAGNTWSTVTTTGAPVARERHTAVWTGTRMIVWGGFYYDGSDHYLSDGGRYDPTNNSWTTVTLSGAPSSRRSHTAVWTGSEMIIWGGENAAGSSASGSRYNPTNNSWTAVTATGAPTARYAHTAVWTGTEMIVWGGYYNLDTGSRYNPTNNSWTAVTATAAPPGRHYHTAVWTGNEMIAWGGEGYLNTGGCYRPAANVWESVTTTGAPDGRYNHTAVWTGTAMVVYGGVGTGYVCLDDTWSYTPAKKMLLYQKP